MPRATRLFNYIYLFTKKYQNITRKLFRASMNISHPIGPQIVPITLSKLGHDVNNHKSPKTHILSNFIIIIELSPKPALQVQCTHPILFKAQGYLCLAIFQKSNSH